MNKIKLVFWVSLLAVFGLAFYLRVSIFNYFGPRIAGFEQGAVNAAVQEIRKGFSAPPPLRSPVRGTTQAQSPGQPTTPIKSGVPAALTRTGIIQWTNTERKDNGSLPALKENAVLDEIAELRLKDMFAKQYFAHVSPASSSAITVAGQIGYDYLALGENLALGNFVNDKDMVIAWMNSPGHRENILNQRYTEIGVAVQQGIFEGEKSWLGVQVFGRPASDCPLADPSLRSAIDANQTQLQGMQQELAAEKADIDHTSPGPQYNEKVDRFNALAGQYNDLLMKTRGMIDAYNNQVEALNQCIAS